MALTDPVLFRTAHGRVIRCACCGQLEIAFAGERLRVPPADFQTVADTVAYAWREIRSADDTRSRWRLAAETPAGAVCVEFRAEEIAALHDLLDGAAATLALDRMLDDVLYS